MRSSLFLSLWLAVSMSFASPLLFGSLFSGITTAATNTATISTLRTDLLSIISQVECYVGTKITTPPILVTNSVLSIFSSITSIFSSIFGTPAATCKLTPASAAAASLSSLRAKAAPEWTSLESLLHTTASMPYILSAIPTTTAKITSSTIKTTSTTSKAATITATSTASSTVPSNTVPSTIKIVTTSSTSSVPTTLSSTIKIVTSLTSTSASSTLQSTSSSSTVSSAVAVGTPCAGNTAADRSKWCDYSVSTDYYNEVPNTGVTREYWLDVAAATIAPDGISRYAQLINNSLPGPTIFADWGDTVVVHLTNSIPNNGSSFHFHGIRQNYTNQHDGVPSITQCPVAPGETYTYKWRATQYGTSWYHSHFSLQAWQGVAGGIVINGPATANYEEDKGILFLSDWGHQTVDELWHYASTVGAPTLENSLINGTNVFGDDGASNQTGSRFETSVVAGTSYRLRLVNGAIDTHYKFSIDNHTLTVISMDFVAIKPYQTTMLSIGIGQRYDVIITADQGAIASDFWIRTTPQMACSTIVNHENIKGILHYGSSTGIPTTTPYAYTDACTDEPLTALVPYLSKNVGTDFYSSDQTVTVGLNAESLFKWYLNSTTFLSDWANPTALQVYNNVTAFAAQDAVIAIPEANKWMYVVVQTVVPVPHPIHLHGHDFFVLAEGSSTYDPSTVSLNLANPPRRDVAMLQASGYLVIAFETDNPGQWLMHCHIGWHTSAGFALQFVERYSEITALLDVPVLQDTCNAWSNYASTGVVQEDSGV